MTKNYPGKAERDPAVHSITDARSPHTDEIRARMIRYSISMGIRVVCLILVFLVSGWLQWVFIAGAVFLPYFAVIIANGGSDTSKMQPSEALLDRAPAGELEAPNQEADGPKEEEDAVVPGEIVDDGDSPEPDAPQDPSQPAGKPSAR